MSFQSYVAGDVSLADIMDTAVHNVLNTVLKDLNRALMDYPKDDHLQELKADVLNHIERVAGYGVPVLPEKPSTTRVIIHADGSTGLFEDADEYDLERFDDWTTIDVDDQLFNEKTLELTHDELIELVKPKD